MAEEKIVDSPNPVSQPTARVFMFPGVGSQFTGMGKSFYDNFKVARDTFEEAGDVMAIDFANLCFNPGEKNALGKLGYAQLALVTVSIASFRVYMQEVGIRPDFCIGHSLGEYSALCSAGVISFPDVLKLVQQRGDIITKTASTLDGTMAWVINLESWQVEEICKRQCEAGDGQVFVSAYDSPGQTSISGHSAVLMEAARKLEKAGAIVYPLKFSGPYHSTLMKAAAQEMEEILAAYSFSPPHTTVIANRNVEPYSTGTTVAQNLAMQLVQPIQWRRTIDYLIRRDVQWAVEMGPKNVLTFLMKKNTLFIAPFACDNIANMNTIADEFILKKSQFLSFIGCCLGIATSTKNHNYDGREYREHVVKPYQRIASLYKSLQADGGQPQKKHLEEALQMLDSVLETKKVSAHEQQQCRLQLWQGKVLPTST